MSENNVLNQLGLTPNEERVYLFLLNTQIEHSASDVVSVLGMDKVSVYRALKSLQQQELIGVSGETRNQQYRVNSSKRLFEKYNKQVQALTGLRDQLEELVQSATSKQNEFYRSQRIRIYKGLDGYKKWNNDRLQKGVKEIYEFSGGAILEKLFHNTPGQQKYLRSFIEARLKCKARMFSLMSAGIERAPYDLSSNELMKEQRIIRLKTEMDGFMSIFGDNFGFYTKQGEEYIGVIINDPILANMMKITFNVLWEQGEEV